MRISNIFGKAFLFSFILALAFFIISFLTLKDYNISWDETIHFRRGQAYLHYFLTGYKTYHDLPSINLQGTHGDPRLVLPPRRSIFENDYHNGEFFFNKDVGHPPLNGILAAIFNYVFYQKLGIFDDVFSYHLFNILISSVLVFIVVYFSFIVFGFLAALVSFLSLVTYPLFFSEAHFNIKDPAETAFFSLFLFCCYLFVRSKKTSWLFGAIIAFALALLIKFNIIFSLIIVVIYFGYLLITGNKEIIGLLKSKKNLLLILLSPVVILLIFIAFWPYLWSNPLNIKEIIYYYINIGSGTSYQPTNFYFLGFNLYPITTILVTTPPVILILTLFGIIGSIYYRKKFLGVTVLFLLWFLTPILRVSILNFSIYGGLRQIMEILPAMALLSGVGVHFLLGILRINTKAKQFLSVFIILVFIFPIIILVKLHPDQNVYFNFLIGGLKGAREINFPSWGNSFGNAYLDGVRWINNNVEKNAKLSLVQGTPSNLPIEELRSDIDFLVNRDINTNLTHFSGINRDGEYLIELTFNDTGKDFYYAWEYTDKFLVPVYQKTVDGVVILKVWKNDLTHTKDRYKQKKPILTNFYDVNFDRKELNISLDQLEVLSELEIDASKSNCVLPSSGFVETSTDGLSNREKDIIGQYQLYRKINIESNVIKYYFAAREAKKITVIWNEDYNCHKSPEIKLWLLK